MPTMKLGLAIYGGGNHIFYSCGVIKYFLEKGIKFDVIATYSAGGAILPYVLDNNIDAALKKFSGFLEKNSKNFYLENLFSNLPVLPHDKIYSTVLKETYEGYSFDGTVDCRLIIAQVYRGGVSTQFVGLMSFLAILFYGISKKVLGAFFLKVFKSAFDIRGVVVNMNNELTADELVNLVLGSSTIYPFITLRKFSSKTMLDGKYSLLTPIGVLEDCDSVISVHGHYTFPTTRENLYSVFPAEPVSAGPMNYTSPEEIHSAFLQGYKEAVDHYKILKSKKFLKN